MQLLELLLELLVGDLLRRGAQLGRRRLLLVHLLESLLVDVRVSRLHVDVEEALVEHVQVRDLAALDRGRRLLLSEVHCSLLVVI